jgi:menaquinone-dependent protoporphyrinogen oxidase
MARIAVVFGTTDGQTAKIARYLTEVLRSEGHAVSVWDTRATVPAAALVGEDAAVIAGSVRMGKFQRALVAFARERRGELARIPTVFLPVSLSAARSTSAARREVRKTIARFIDETGFGPGAIEPVAGALAYSRYGFWTRLAMILISKMSGGDTDTSRDYEYTDWAAVAEIARRFGARVREQQPAPAGSAPEGWHADAAL